MSSPMDFQAGSINSQCNKVQNLDFNIQGFMVFNTTFKKFSVIWWRSALLVEEKYPEKTMTTLIFIIQPKSWLLKFHIPSWFSRGRSRRYKLKTPMSKSMMMVGISLSAYPFHIFQARTWISNIICRGLFLSVQRFEEKRWLFFFVGID